MLLMLIKLINFIMDLLTGQGFQVALKLIFKVAFWLLTKKKLSMEAYSIFHCVNFFHDQA